MTFVVLSNKQFNFSAISISMANILCLCIVYVVRVCLYSEFRTAVLYDIIKWSSFLHLNRMKMNKLMKRHSNDEFIYFLRFSFSIKYTCNVSNCSPRLFFCCGFCSRLVLLHRHTFCTNKFNILLKNSNQFFMQTQRNFPFNFQQFDKI